ncbi:hypothetical protein [Embleya scabrispora]|uniref:hypothetical protein n=1 Tax=Embleya scabrispora TaxID=159449 RepID=UPI00036DA4C7|nr:hypothetical protein [Embleya scabrispora]MYS80452.1 hypothetical protein [Streptomyces sp. SID5474]
MHNAATASAAPAGHGAPTASPSRWLDPQSWRARRIPLLRDPRALIKRLHDLHQPVARTAVVAVLDRSERPVASASFGFGEGRIDGWRCRNLILANLRLIVPDDLRRPTPTHTTVLAIHREGTREWETDDGRWMWGLHDACVLHGMRCGAIAIVAQNGWQLVADGRSGRTPALPASRKRGPGGSTPIRAAGIAPAHPATGLPQVRYLPETGPTPLVRPSAS